MDKFQITLTEHATHDLADLPKEVRGRIHKDLRTLASDPFPFGTHIKRLRGFRPPVYRLRSGDFRVLYHIQGNTVTILRVIEGKLLERLLKRLTSSHVPAGRP